VLTTSDYIQTEDLPSDDVFQTEISVIAQDKSSKGLSFEDEKPITLDELCKKYIQHIFDKNGGAKEQTAKDLGIDRKTLYRKLKDMNLN
jgi:DNA-binding NtrC family response regulator